MPVIKSKINTNSAQFAENHANMQAQVDDLKEKLQHLKVNLDARNQKLIVSEKAQQFFFDANEAEAWMSEQELYMMVDDRGKDEFSAQNLMKIVPGDGLLQVADGDTLTALHAPSGATATARAGQRL